MPDDERSAILQRLSVIETKVDGLSSADADDANRYRRLSDRLARVERFMWLALGFAVASGVPDVVRLMTSSVV